MRYYVKNNTLVIKGDFDGISTGINGGRKRVQAVINHQVPEGFDRRDPLVYMNEVASKLNVEEPYFGLMTAVYMKNLCIVRDGNLTAFITAGISNPCHDPGVPGTINVILLACGKMSEGAMASAIITATEAKTKALFDMGFDFTGTTTDTVTVLCDDRKPCDSCDIPYYEYSGTYTDPGRSIYRCVKKGVEEGIKRQHMASGSRDVNGRIFVLAGGDEPFWVSHPKEECGKDRCKYYPCHFEGQDCTHCYCPLYPCEDPELGKWIKSSKGYPVWSCKDCTLLHKREAVEYLAKHPEATTEELKNPC